MKNRGWLAGILFLKGFSSCEHAMHNDQHSHAERIGEQVYGPPDLVVEVISSGTPRLDRGQKFLEYASAGVDEYWLVDPQAQTIEVFALEEGTYTLSGKFGPGEGARSQMLTGFEVPVDEVFA